MKSAFLTLASAGAIALVAAVPAQAVVIESFDSGSYGAAWTLDGTPTITAGAAHDGAFGVEDNNFAWAYRTDVTVNNGDTLSAWVRPGGSRFYLGFGASAGGASSFVIAPNTGELIFQNNVGYGFSNTTATGFSFTQGKWYLASVTLGPSTVGTLYDSDGTTVLGSLVATGLVNGAGGGVAVRSFGGVSFDTISLSSSSGAVPEPASWALMIVGFGLVGVSMRRRKAVAAA
jgi:hypothetical protein